MVMSSTAPLPAGVVIEGGDRRQRSTTAFTATTLASLFLLTTTLHRSSFPTVATAFSVHNSATAVVVAFRQPNSITSNRTTRRFLPGDSSQLLLHSSRHNDDDAYAQQNYCRRRHTTLVAIAIASTQLLFSPILSSNPMAFAYNYDESDKYASETVTNVVTKLQGSAGDVDATFNTLEEVAKIITEGKGVGGTLTYGVCIQNVVLASLSSPSQLIYVLCFCFWLLVTQTGSSSMKALSPMKIPPSTILVLHY